MDPLQERAGDPAGDSRQPLLREVCAGPQIPDRELHAGNTSKTSSTVENIHFLLQEESPEGGRFKKEVVVDGQSYLLLIRDEGGPPELQVQLDLINISQLKIVNVTHS